MNSVRKGLRAGDIEKGTYERLTCTDCGKQLEARDDPDEVGRIRYCPACGSEWKKLG